MRGRNAGSPVVDAEAVVHRIDPINRELTACVGGVLRTIYVPPGCDVILRGEPVKLRLVQPRDRLRVSFSDRADSLTARKVVVLPAYSPVAVAR